MHNEGCYTAPDEGLFCFLLWITDQLECIDVAIIARKGRDIKFSRLQTHACVLCEIYATYLEAALRLVAECT